MEKDNILIVRITENQNRILEANARANGFVKKSDYVRYILFLRNSTDDMIKQIYEKVIKNDNRI